MLAMRASSWSRVALAALAASTAACIELPQSDDPPVEPPPDDPDPPPVDPIDPPSPPGACPVRGVVAARSLADTDPIALAPLTFARVLDRVRETAGATATPRLALYQAWFRTFGASPAAGDCDDPDRDPEGYGLRCPRAPEARLASIDPFAAAAVARFEPVAVFDRFDLAPGDGATCGEYRIVYALRAEPFAPVRGPGFVIVEAALPNPTPAAGVDACLPVARFWHALSSENDPARRAAQLEQFFFTGGAVAGFPAAIDARHLGLADNAATFARGQLRTNLFIDEVEWALREFKLRRTCVGATCALAVVPVPVAANPADELVAGTHPRAAAFADALAAQVDALAGPRVAELSLAIDPIFDELESVSMPGTATVRYRARAAVALRVALQRQLTATGSSLTTSNLLDRATTQTCAGCHDVSSNADLGGGLFWPPSNGFTHVDERGTLSPALTDVFLPHRAAVLERFINDRCGTARVAAPVDPSRTLGGSVVGAAN
jgi:hypothetical protein